MGKKENVQILVNGGMQDEGDPALFEKGVCALLKNVEYIDDGLYARQPFASDYLAPTETPIGLFLWEDRANRILRMMAATITAAVQGKLLVKSSSGTETWTQVGGVNAVAMLPVSSFANYRGVVYFASNDGKASPAQLTSYDGSTLKYWTDLSIGITARALCIFNERMYLAYLSLTVLNQLPHLAVYDPTKWTLTNVATSKTTAVVGGVTTVRWNISPTTVTGAVLELLGAFYGGNASLVPAHIKVLVALQGVDSTYSMPMTVEVVFRGSPWVLNTAYILGFRVHPITPNGFVFVATAAGTSAGTEPTWPTTIGSSVVDGGVTWKAESSDIIQTQKIEVPSTSVQTNLTEIYIDIVIPPTAVGSSYPLMLRYKFGTVSTPSVSLVPIQFSFQDGLADGNILKKNFGQQLTQNSFEFPFVNAQTTLFGDNFYQIINLPDVGAWSEPGQPEVIEAQNTVLLIDEPGELTSIIVAGGRLWWFKRRAAWSYLVTKDPDFPIVREKVYTGIGSISPKGLDRLDDFLFAIAENQIYGWNASQSPISPIGLCPEGIRRTVMGHGATWVENIPDPLAGSGGGQAYMAILRVHPVRKQLWIHTQDHKVFVYDIEGKRWSYFEIPKSGGFARIRDIEWNPTTNRMMVMCENGIVRQALREEVSGLAAIAITASGSSYSGTITVTISAPTLPGGIQATATATQSGGHINTVTIVNAGTGYPGAPTVTVAGSTGGTGAVLTATLLDRDGDASGNVFDSEKRIRLHPFETRPERQVMTVEDVALYGKLTIGDSASTCEVDISFDGGETFAKYDRVSLTPLSQGGKRRYPIPVRKTGESLVIDVAHTGATGNDVFNVLDVDSDVIIRGPEQPKTRPTQVAKTI